jgi:hypothetical protein
MHPKDCTRNLIENNRRVDSKVIEYMYAKSYLEDKARIKDLKKREGSKDIKVKEKSKISIAKEIAENLSAQGINCKSGSILKIMDKLRRGPMIGGICVEKGPDEKGKIFTLSEVQELLRTLINTYHERLKENIETA